jgi:hypothetical protein
MNKAAFINWINKKAAMATGSTSESDKASKLMPKSPTKNMPSSKLNISNFKKPELMPQPSFDEHALRMQKDTSQFSLQNNQSANNPQPFEPINPRLKM